MTNRFSFRSFLGPTHSRTIVAAGLLVGFGVVFTGVGCTGMSDGALGGECMLDSDCKDDLICAYQFCHIPCTETRDCDVAGGEECLMSHETDKDPYNYCTIPIACSRDAECGDSRVCAEDKKCRDACFQDDDCLGDQRCFQGACRNVANPPAAGWDAPAGLGAPCKIASDCASKNCNGICVGCTEDFDCGGNRTCDPTALDGSGMCSGGSGQLNAKVTPIDVGGAPVRDAVPDSKGEYIYFLAYSSVARIGPDGVVCTLFSSPDFHPGRIAISTDDSTLFVNTPWPVDSMPLMGISTIILPDSSTCASSVPKTIPWTTAGENPGSLVVFPSANDETISFLGYDELYAGSASNGALWLKGVPVGSEITIGGGRTFVLTTMSQLAEILPNKSLNLLAAHVDLDDLDTSLDFSRGTAVNLANDTIYVPDYRDGQEAVVAIDVENPLLTKRYGMDLSVFVESLFHRNMHRAQKRNIFSWVTGEHKLYLFEPL